MSKKKLTQQWRKPIEQLKQEKQQNTPIPQDFDQKKKIAMELMAEKYSKPSYKREEERPAKKMFKKKGALQGEQKISSQSVETKQTPKASQVNWLQLQQFASNSQLSQLINESLNMFRLKYLPQLKQLLIKIRQKYHIEGLEYVLNQLFKQNFTFTYENLINIGLDITKLNSKIVNNIFFYLLQAEQLQKLSLLISNLRTAQYHLDSREDEIFQILFWKETSHDIKFEAGQNGINISLDNKLFVQKLSLAQQYLELISENNKKKRSSKRPNIAPLWLNKTTKIVLRYKFAHNQFQRLLTQILTHHEYILPESFFESQQFSFLLSEFYFGNQDSLKLVLDIVQKNFTLKSVKLSIFYRNFTNQLMNFRIQNGRPAFKVDETLIESYKKAFELHHKLLAIVCTIIASDAHYKQLPQHYVKSYMQGFPNESLQSEDTKFVEQGILNNYNHTLDAEHHEKYLQRLVKSGPNLLMKLKASIKLGQLQQAYNIFEESVYKKIAVQRMRKNIEFVLRRQLGFGYTNFMRVRQINDFIYSLEDQYLWSLYTKSQDVSVMVKNYLPENQDKFSFWQEKQKKQQFEEISRKLATGQLNKVKQPQSDVQATGFSLDNYLENQLPQLRQLEAKQYEKEKQLIKYALNIEGLLLTRKIHNDVLIIERLGQVQAQLGEQNLALIDSFGLKDYNIPEWGWEHFEKRYLKMKQQNNIMRDERVDWSGYARFIQRNKSLTNKSFIQEMIIKTPQLFKQAEALVKLDQQPLVERLLIWGVYTNEPMAVYLAQKLAMQTGQQIPHELALKVSRMLSYKRPLSEQFIQKCKDCLKIVGKIDREFIYSFDKEYEHILLRKNFISHVENKIEDHKVDNRDLEDLITYIPRQQLFQQQNKIYEQSIISRAQQTV